MAKLPPRKCAASAASPPTSEVLVALVLANLLTLYRAELADGTVHRADQRSGDTAALARSHPAGKSRERLFGQQVLGKNFEAVRHTSSRKGWSALILEAHYLPAGQRLCGCIGQFLCRHTVGDAGAKGLA